MNTWSSWAHGKMWAMEEVNREETRANTKALLGQISKGKSHLVSAHSKESSGTGWYLHLLNKYLLGAMLGYENASVYQHRSLMPWNFGSTEWRPWIGTTDRHLWWEEVLSSKTKEVTAENAGQTIIVSSFLLTWAERTQCWAFIGATPAGWEPYTQIPQKRASHTRPGGGEHFGTLKNLQRGQCAWSNVGKGEKVENGVEAVRA